MAALSTTMLLLIFATLGIVNCQSPGPKVVSKLNDVPDTSTKMADTAEQTATLLESNEQLMTTMVDLLNKHDQLLATQNILIQGLSKQEDIQNQIMSNVVGMLQKHEDRLDDIKQQVDGMSSPELPRNMASSKPNTTERKSPKTDTSPDHETTPIEEPTTNGFFSKDCDDIWNKGYHENGIFRIDPESTCTSKSFFKVSCDLETNCGGWIVIQRRFDGSEKFARGWDDYSNGFGNLTGEHWLGLEKLHRLTNDGKWKLRVEMEDFSGQTTYAEYLNFAIGDRSTYYQLSFGSYRGVAGDSLMYGKDVNEYMPFSTYDNDHDGIQDNNCAQKYNSGWWFNACGQYSNVNGPYIGKPKHTYDAIIWYAWKGDEALKRSELKIRRM